MQCFGRALEILKEMPTGRSRDSRELRLQMAIRFTAFMYQAESSAEVGKALERALSWLSHLNTQGRKFALSCYLVLI
jgi:hypothetical protein